MQTCTIKQLFAVLFYFYLSCVSGFSAGFVNFRVAYVKFHIYNGKYVIFHVAYEHCITYRVARKTAQFFGTP